MKNESEKRTAKNPSKAIIRHSVVVVPVIVSLIENVFKKNGTASQINSSTNQVAAFYCAQSDTRCKRCYSSFLLCATLNLLASIHPSIRPSCGIQSSALSANGGTTPPAFLSYLTFCPPDLVSLLPTVLLAYLFFFLV